MTNSTDEIEDTDCILVLGSNTTSQHPIISGKFMKAREKGAKLIVVDPRHIPLSHIADLFLPIKPGTNIAFINGIIHILINKGLIDETFIHDRTEGFEKLKEKIKEYPPDRVAEITGITTEALEKAATLYGQAGKAMLFYCMGITQHITGTDNVKAVANLAMVSGNIGRLGTGVNPLRGQNNVQGACDMGALPNVMTGYQKISDPKVIDIFSNRWGYALPTTEGLAVTEMLGSDRGDIIKAMMIMGENPMSSDPDTNHVRKKLSELDFLCVQDIFMTETAKLAHVILPASSFAEKEGTFTATDRRVQRVRKAVDPIGDSKPDWRIIAELATEMGASGFEYSSPREIMEEISGLTPSYAGISYGRLDNGAVLHWPCPDENHPGTPMLHENAFPCGKGKFFPVDYAPPSESPDEEYPFLLNTGRIPFHFHGGIMTRKSKRLEQEAPRGYVNINPDDAKKLNIEDGDFVKVTSRRGEVMKQAKISTEVEPGMAFIPMHFLTYSTNTLTGMMLDPQSKIPSFKTCAVRIEK